jgi:hypothetical protein
LEKINDTELHNASLANMVEFRIGVAAKEMSVIPMQTLS